MSPVLLLPIGDRWLIESRGEFEGDFRRTAGTGAHAGPVNKHLLRAKDRSKVEGWSLLFKPGTQQFLLTAPDVAGDYEVLCTVICSEDHEGMHMKLVVLPKGS